MENLTLWEREWRICLNRDKRCVEIWYFWLDKLHSTKRREDTREMKQCSQLTFIRAWGLVAKFRKWKVSACSSHLIASPHTQWKCLQRANTENTKNVIKRHETEEETVWKKRCNGNIKSIKQTERVTIDDIKFHDNKGHAMQFKWHKRRPTTKWKWICSHS